MHNRQPVSPKELFKSLCDYDLWPLYMIGLTFETPMTTPAQYLTLTLRNMGFETLAVNLLTIPSKLLSIITMLTLTYMTELLEELSLISMISQIWALPFVAYLYFGDISTTNKWAAWVIMTLLLGYPSRMSSSISFRAIVLKLTPTAHPIQVAWNSRNSNTVRTRTVSAALYNMCVQTSGIIASNIYRAGKLVALLFLAVLNRLN